MQPVFDTPMNSAQAPIQVQLNFRSDSYSGGANITFTGGLNGDALFKTRLFLAEIILEDLPVHVSYSVSSENSSILGLSFGLTSNDDGEQMRILLAAGGKSFLPANLLNQFDEVITPSLVAEKKTLTGPSWILHESSIEIPGHTLTEIYAVCYPKADHSSSKLVPDQEQNLRKDSIVASSSFHAALGHISIKTSQTEFPNAASWMLSCENTSWTTASGGNRMINTKIIWELKTGDASTFMRYNIFVKRISKQLAAGSSSVIANEDFLGVTRLNCYYVSDLKVPAGVTTLVFIVQVCGLDGSCQKLEESPSFELPVEEKLINVV
ncbi:hypothetical protein Taro_051152 [Colocasia esculenta]|uniref:Cytosolic endo-beta-N-acetylglucosaminidase C-terminal domain-containing protein n=1 Tax=Colocasia esculenta TaxID=4460 RepID=A0A843XFA3_COLES|nr:hypothetical protein [Colocasia esculenta]